MTIDEVIEQEIKQVEMYRCEYECDCDYYGQDFIDDYYDELDYIKKMREHEQLAEWLEELKVYQQHEIICNNGYNAGYKKAIDDFERIMCEELKDYIDHKDYMCVGFSLHKFTRDLAKQLKAGGDNERNGNK